MRLLDEVPEALLVLGELAVAKVLLHLLHDVGSLLLQLLHHVLLPGVVLVLAAHLMNGRRCRIAEFQDLSIYQVSLAF